ncbi:DUF2490 domain-containing protein [Winogradskyella bathintestinalis]|uniref:DUF2490 domain-containing protein n=1 Tax=Winogradskyella bathintestinalis TaxID=3035208 RepID=A0ABT7ZSU7_9FLAO|nr:DUF2490 domain-containing protein [Winogradskyella bathintestinalis]MDN3492026.1 DUF2490 domain-containing protein [Winogradskyella bathintestinalis]
MRYKILIVCIVFVLPVAAQENYTLFFEPEIKLEYRISSKYSHSFGIENRNFVYNDATYNFSIKHLEFSHTSEYALNSNQSLAVGIQYRFEKNFKPTEENEFRFLQAFEWGIDKTLFSMEQKIRTEQRFYSSTSKYRLRYELGLTFPLNRSNRALNNVEKNTVYIKAETETLFEIAKTQKPELEQRLSSVFGWQFGSSTGFEIGLQYRLADYTQNIGHELFLITGVEIELKR